MTARRSLKFNIAAMLALTTITGADQENIVSKKSITAEDNFYIECDVFKFSLDRNDNFQSIYEMFVERKLDVEKNYLDLGRYYPFGSLRKGRTKQTPPGGRLWDYEFRGGDDSANRNVVRITVHVKDATCADAGFYRCGMQTARSGPYIYSTPYRVTTAVNTIQQGSLTMIPTSGHNNYFSKNKVGDNIVLECTLTGPPNLQTWWTYSKKKKPDLEAAYPVTKDISTFPSESALDCNACLAYFYTTNLQFSMNADADGNTYYCSASDGKALNSKANFTVYIE